MNIVTKIKNLLHYLWALISPAEKTVTIKAEGQEEQRGLLVVTAELLKVQRELATAIHAAEMGKAILKEAAIAPRDDRESSKAPIKDYSRKEAEKTLIVLKNEFKKERRVFHRLGPQYRGPPFWPNIFLKFIFSFNKNIR